MSEYEGHENGIAFWEARFCKYCKKQLCKETAQAKQGLLVGQGPRKDYQSCMLGFQLAIQLGERDIVRKFRKQGNPKEAFDATNKSR